MRDTPNKDTDTATCLVCDWTHHGVASHAEAVQHHKETSHAWELRQVRPWEQPKRSR